ncbi:cysteine proteinase [Gloeophyllum trabeum ATCC 11539]|uniref:ubiquitinyl hydrolase 1 n=1 Tax=Gloeophyllum trabeum (strain ATCC 11539 / FP-39264 / Madison 617) TaxID=670483 RepID=S7QFZ0_GLOTA|nr:cysteine proteinase [Gloeophyllum trabeum ATCC 11539]EPQ58342.1 cysteine proteinase [Gloeophyllum trabeum ATCC 11539]
MAPARRRRKSPANNGLAAGEKLKREVLQGSRSNLWSWVGIEVTNVSDITDEHRLMSCGLSKRNGWPICRNKYASGDLPQSKGNLTRDAAHSAADEDIIVISDDETGLECSRKACKNNPNCLNYLGQEAWENEEKAKEAYLKAAELGPDPRLQMRDPGSPVGLKNLGATCYANAFLQVWFQDLAFRAGVYRCMPTQDWEHGFQDTPVFQLQVTFAALQEGSHKVFNPVKLVESLRLRTTEQQDAQEFSKLFMSYLDAEFKKQSEPSLRTLIPDQFQGTQVYGTECLNCHNRSETLSEFLELEISLQPNCRLEQRIDALLQPETLSGDNKYLCPRCETLQDATRYTKLRELPPVLHISLMRFVYDLGSMERKKCSHSVTFPTVLDMDQFLDRSPGDYSQPGDSKNLYRLQGVLLHKGASALHGHYEAQVYDIASKQWYRFNDESVSALTSMPYLPLPDEADEAVEIENKSNGRSSKSSTKAQSTNRKRQTRKAGDEANVQTLPSMLGLPESRKYGQSGQAYTTRYIASKEAYMLIYRREMADSRTCDSAVGATRSASPPFASTGDETIRIIMPPARAREVVNVMNEELREAIKDYRSKQEQKVTELTKLRRVMMDILHSWNVTSHDEPSLIVSGQSLEAWVVSGLKEVERKGKQALKTVGVADEGELCTESQKSAPDSSSTQCGPSVRRRFSNSTIACRHGLLDPMEAGDMKRLRKTAYERIVQETNSEFLPVLSSGDICHTCVAEQFDERLYQTEHPNHVARFNKLSTDDGDTNSYWISKTWLKDWKLSKPKMHRSGQEDPAPNLPPFQQDVLCEHGYLSTDGHLRRRIPAQAYDFLIARFPELQLPSVDTEVCAICQTTSHVSKEERLEWKSKADLEKRALNYMYENALEHHGELPPNIPCAIIPPEFVSAWRQWVRQPSQVQRPDKVDNSMFICRHGLLLIDPSSAIDIDGSVAVIPMGEWAVLKNHYPAKPLISVENRYAGEGSRIVCDLPVCHDCRFQKKSDYTETDINLRICNAQGLQEDLKHSQERPRISIYGTRGARRSKRIRHGVYKANNLSIRISKAMTLKDLKLKLQEERDLPVICQRLFYCGQELGDNSLTMGTLGILPNDTIDVREEPEDADALDDEGDGLRKKRRLEKEGQAFDGTILSGQHRTSSSPESRERETEVTLHGMRRDP